MPAGASVFCVPRKCEGCERIGKHDRVGALLFPIKEVLA